MTILRCGRLKLLDTYLRKGCSVQNKTKCRRALPPLTCMCCSHVYVYAQTSYYSFTPPEDALYSFSTCNMATFGTYESIHRLILLPPRPLHTALASLPQFSSLHDPPRSFSSDTRIVVMSQCGNLSSIMTCNDDGPECSSFTSITTPVTMNAGQTYFVAVGAYSSSSGFGSGTLRVIQSVIPTSAPTAAGETLSPTQAPATCTTPRPLVVGANTITNEATGVSVSVSGSTCFFETDPQTLTQVRRHACLVIRYERLSAPLCSLRMLIVWWSSPPFSPPLEQVSYYSFQPSTTGPYRFSTCLSTGFGEYASLP
jgi:hypothetical protein